MAIEIFPGAVQFEFPVEIAKETLKNIKKIKNEWQDSMVGSARVAKHIRSSQSFNLDSLSIAKEKIRPELYKCVKEYCQYYDIEVIGDEGLNLLKYESYDKYEFHIDHSPGMNRAVSCLIYLNPGEYTGGGTIFKHFDYTVNPVVPSLVLFPSNYPYLHAAQQVSNGIKYIIVSWMNDRQSHTY